MQVQKREIINFTIRCLTGGILYFYLEIAFRGFSHYSMFICGGLCFAIICEFGKRALRDGKSIIFAILKIMFLGSLVITTLEYITGIIFNIYLKQEVWDYSELKYNVDGQICAIYSLLWAVLSLICVCFGEILERFVFDDEYMG